MNLSPERKIKFYKVLKIALLAALVAVGVSFLTETVRNESNRQENTITFLGMGKFLLFQILLMSILLLVKIQKQ